MKRNAKINSVCRTACRVGEPPYQGLNDRIALTDIEEKFIAPDLSELPSSEDHDLIQQTNSEDRVLGQVLILSKLDGIDEGDRVLSGRFRLGIILLAAHGSIDLVFEISLPDLLGGTGKGMLIASSDLPFGRHGHSGEHVGDVRSVGMLEPELFKESSSLCSRTIVDGQPLMKNHDVVDQIVDSISGLIQCHDGSQA